MLPGCPAFALTITPKDCGQPEAFVDRSVKQEKPSLLVRLTKPPAFNRTTPVVWGLPRAPSETLFVGTDCVRGLSGTCGRNLIGRGVGGALKQRSAAGFGGRKMLGAGTVPITMLESERPLSARTTLPKALPTLVSDCVSPFESR